MPAQSCRICRNSFPLNTTYFGPDPGNANYHRSACRSCLADEARKRYEADPETYRRKARERRKTRAAECIASGIWRAV
jgi:hypothetical protein